MLGLFLLTLPASLLASPLRFCGVAQSAPLGRSLGLSSVFGKWPDGIIPIAYNPAGAPPKYQDTAKMLAYLQHAFSQWANVSDVRFKFQGITNHLISNREDKLVVVGWVNTLATYYALTAPTSSDSVWYANWEAAGHTVYTDGFVELNAPAMAKDDREFMPYILTHEFGHLLGLGHSDNPRSILYANPYGAFSDYVFADDILGAQSIYGLPDDFIPPPSLQPFNLLSKPYHLSPLTVSTVGRTANDDGSWTDRVVLNRVDTTTPDDLVVFGKLTYRPLPAGEALTVVTISPDGTVFSKRQVTEAPLVSQEPQTIYTDFGNKAQLQTQSGVWHQYGLINDQLFFSLALEVALPAISWNKPPEASITLHEQPGNNFKFILDASDPEQDALTVIWHVPGQVTTAKLSERITERRYDHLNAVGIYDLYVELNDNAQRYANSGEGFRKLINKQWVVTANKNRATYFVTEQLLYLPQLEILGQGMYSARLKATHGQQNVFKVQELLPLAEPIDTTIPLPFYAPETQQLTLPEVDVITNNLKPETFTQIRFQLLANSTPLKLKRIVATDP